MTLVARCALAVMTTLLVHTALAQRTNDNAVTAAEDAFGATLGDESIGLYSSSHVRGFSPVTAGNVRIEGLYFDRQAWLPARLVEGSTIRVGLSALGYPFPAPTGIVDYRLQQAHNERVVSLATGIAEYAAPFIEVDAKIPLSGAHLGIAGGVSYAHEEYYDGADARYLAAALAPRWRPSAQIEVVPFWSLTRGRGEETPPTLVTTGPYLPPRIERRRLFGPSWAKKDTDSTTHGVLTKARLGKNWALAGGVFRSVLETHGAYADVYLVQRDGMARELLSADPPQRAASTSAELRVSRSFAEADRLHLVHLSMRGRARDRLYGGAAPALDLGVRPLGEPVASARPASLLFHQRTRDEVRESTLGLGYDLRWRGIGEASLGLQRASYEKRIDQPGLVRATTHDEPWLASGMLAAHLTPEIAIYGGYARGLEESGIAPAGAANRDEVLPAILTRQADAGIRWRIDPALALVAGVFKVEKPYFAANERNVHTELGEVSHRGVELSLAGTLTEHWSVVAGAVLMEPRVTGPAVDAGRIGRRAVGQSERVVRTNLEYRPPALAALSIDLAVSHNGERVASSDGARRLPAYTLIDLGARYRMRLAGAPATLRVQVANLTDEFHWNLFASNTFGLTDARRYSATLFVDF